MTGHTGTGACLTPAPAVQGPYCVSTPGRGSPVSSPRAGSSPAGRPSPDSGPPRAGHLAATQRFNQVKPPVWPPGLVGHFPGGIGGGQLDHAGGARPTRVALWSSGDTASLSLLRRTSDVPPVPQEDDARLPPFGLLVDLGQHLTATEYPSSDRPRDYQARRLLGWPTPASPPKDDVTLDHEGGAQGVSVDPTWRQVSSEWMLQCRSLNVTHSFAEAWSGYRESSSRSMARCGWEEGEDEVEDEALLIRWSPRGVKEPLRAVIASRPPPSSWRCHHPVEVDRGCSAG